MWEFCGDYFRYVDDTHTKQKSTHTEEFLTHINSIDPHIQFTTEEKTNGALAFLDTLSVRQPDGSLKVKVYRKPTHTDQYLLFDSNHPLDHKLGVVKTLHKRAHTIVIDSGDKQQEIQHVNDALKHCKYPDWAIKRAIKPRPPNQPQKDNSTNAKKGPGWTTEAHLCGRRYPSLFQAEEHHQTTTCIS